MGGFLGGLGELLLGANSLKRIKDDGFDWREQDAFRDFERNKAREQYGTQVATDYLSTAEEPDEATAATAFGPDVDTARRKLLIGAAAGKARQQKSALADQKATSDAYLQSLRNAGGVNRVMAAAQAAVPGREDTQQHQMDMLEQRLEAAEREGRLDRKMAEALAEIRAGKEGGSGAGKWAWDNEANTSVWVTPEQLSGAPPGKYADVVSGRQGAAGASAAGAFDELVQNADTMLARYEATNKGWGRVVPAQARPTKLVAWNAYLNSLQTLAQLMGRTVLGDNRVSDQDRVAYANAIGSTSQLVNALDPKEARRRLDVLRNIKAEYDAKYGRLPVGGGAQPPGAPPPNNPLAPLRGAGGGRKYGVRPAGGN